MGQNCAITIGINKYNFMQPLCFAKQDAEAMRDFFLEDLACNQIYHFTEGAPNIKQDYGPFFPSRPTYVFLKRFLRTRFENSFLESSDTLWFFFAGHGIRYNEKDYLLPIDGDPGDLENTALLVNQVTDNLRKSGAGKVILLLDACRSQSRRSGLGIGSKIQQQGVISIFSCSPEESSYEINEICHGSFTYILLKGLRSNGNSNCATVGRLYTYLYNNVPRLNSNYHLPKQHPYSVIEPPWVLNEIILPKFANNSDLINLKNEALDAEVKGLFILAKQLWIEILSLSPTNSEAIDAIERLVIKTKSSSNFNESIDSIDGYVVSETDLFSKHEISSDPSQFLKVNQNSGIFTDKFLVVTLNEYGVEIERFWNHTQFHEEYLSEDVSIILVPIPQGNFHMGSPISEIDREEREGPQHLVNIQSFWMSRFPITQDQWFVVSQLPKINIVLDPYPSKFRGNSNPVESVNWFESIEFCSRISKKLGYEFSIPSESEWEYACRAGTNTPFYFGDTLNGEIANYNSKYIYGLGPKSEYIVNKTQNIGLYPSNNFGLSDFHGNVWEWCLDHWHDSYIGAPNNGSSWITDKNSSCRLIRGGSWNRIPSFCRSATRNFMSPNTKSNSVGFRIVYH